MYKLAYLERIADDCMRKRASFISRVADTVNFAANAKVLNDMTNETLSKSLEDKDDNGIPDRKERSGKPKGVSVLLTGDLKDRIPEEQRQKIIAIARRISADRREGRKK